MQIIHFTATDARNNFFNILDEVAKGKEARITKDNKFSFSLKSTPLKKKKNMKHLLKNMASGGVSFQMPWEKMEEIIETKHNLT